MLSQSHHRLLPRVAAAVAAAALLVSAPHTAAAQPPTTAQADPPTYADVPAGHWAAEPISSLAAAGVFADTGCGDASFCPEDALDRKTMAVWVVRLLDGGDPAAVTSTSFDDVDAAGFHAAFIERMFDRGVTRGCGEGASFCPDDPVTRAQMAVFLSRAYDLADGEDPGFADVPAGHWAGADIAKLAASGITHGCGNESFCPSDDTTRAQMATFLWRAENQAEPEMIADGFDVQPTPSWTAEYDGPDPLALAEPDHLTLTLDDFRPAAPGQLPPPAPRTTGEMPAPTPAIIAFSDWCYYDFEPSSGTIVADYCGLALHIMYWGLLAGADEACVVAQYREHLPQILGADGRERDILSNTYGWWRCGTVVSPDPPSPPECDYRGSGGDDNPCCDIHAGAVRDWLSNEHDKPTI